MPKQVITFNVFISSPSNLSTERLVIEKVLAELSIELAAERDIAFEVFKWESDAVPGIGKEAQAVISSQLNYDIYIGLLGSVFGSATQRYGSGTEEEFNQAYERYQKAPESVRVLFYFKNASENIFNISLEELSKVKSFRDQLGGLGTLYHDFSDLDSLRGMIRTNVRNLIVKQWDSNKWRVLSPPNPPIAPQVKDYESGTGYDSLTPELPRDENFDLAEDDKPGFLEAIMIGNEVTDALNKHMERMGDLGKGLGKTVTEVAHDLATANATGNLILAKEIYDQIGTEMREFTVSMRSELPIYESVSKDLIATLGNIFSFYSDEKMGSQEEISSLFLNFEALVNSVRGIRSSLQQFHGIIDSMPSMTQTFRAARKHLSRVLDEFTSSYTIFLGTADALLTEVKLKLNNESIEVA